MANYSATLYKTALEAKAAIDAILPTKNVQIIPFSDPRSGQCVMIAEKGQPDFDTVIFENTLIVPYVTETDLGITAAYDISNYENIMLFVKTTKNIEVYVQLTDDGGVNPDWYDLCTAAGAALSFTCSVASKAIYIPVKGMQMRCILKNNDTANDSPYIGVM